MQLTKILMYLGELRVHPRSWSFYKQTLDYLSDTSLYINKLPISTNGRQKLFSAYLGTTVQYSLHNLYECVKVHYNWLGAFATQKEYFSVNNGVCDA